MHTRRSVFYVPMKVCASNALVTASNKEACSARGDCVRKVQNEDLHCEAFSAEPLLSHGSISAYSWTKSTQWLRLAWTLSVWKRGACSDGAGRKWSVADGLHRHGRTPRSCSLPGFLGNQLNARSKSGAVFPLCGSPGRDRRVPWHTSVPPSFLPARGWQLFIMDVCTSSTNTAQQVQIVLYNK